MKRKSREGVKEELSGALIIDCERFGCNEISQMNETILRKKRRKFDKVVLVEYRNSSSEDVLSRILFPSGVVVRQLIITAHGEYYDEEGIFVLDYDLRNIGQYKIHELSSFIFLVLEEYPDIEEVKFYVCETSSNHYCQRNLIKKKLRKRPSLHIDSSANHHRNERKRRIERKELAMLQLVLEEDRETNREERKRQMSTTKRLEQLICQSLMKTIDLEDMFF